MNLPLCPKSFEPVQHFSSKDGMLYIGEYNIVKLIGNHRTPIYIYDGNIIETTVNNIKECFHNFDIYFSLKSNPSLGIVSFFNSLGCGAEVASIGEIEIALLAGCDPENIIFAGPAKKREELLFAIEIGIKAINVESFRELLVIEEIAQDLEKEVNVAIRVNTIVDDIDTPEVMVGHSSRFGIDEDDVITKLGSIKLRQTNIVGVHFYTASQIMSEDTIARNFERTIRVTHDLKSIIPKVKYVFFGGGLGIPNNSSESELNIQYQKSHVESVLNHYRSSIQDIQFGIELGRYLVAKAGVFITQIVDVKYSGEKCFVATDGGMNHFLRPVFMKVRHPAMIVNKLDRVESVVADIGGPLCTPLDILSPSTNIPEPEPGDLIAYFNAGAYGLTMSMQEFLGHNSPLELLIYQNKYDIIRQSISTKDRLKFQKKAYFVA